MTAFYTFLLIGNFIQSMAIVGLLMIVSDLEKLTNRKAAKGGWTFQNPGWRYVAAWGASLVACFPFMIVLASSIQGFAAKSVTSESRQEVQDLQARVHILEDKLSKVTSSAK